jgi:hypothetical protein
MEQLRCGVWNLCICEGGIVIARCVKGQHGLAMKLRKDSDTEFATLPASCEHCHDLTGSGAADRQRPTWVSVSASAPTLTNQPPLLDDRFNELEKEGYEPRFIVTYDHGNGMVRVFARLKE